MDLPDGSWIYQPTLSPHTHVSTPMPTHSPVTSARAGSAAQDRKKSAADDPPLPPMAASHAPSPMADGGAKGRSVETIETCRGWQYSCTAVSSPAGTAEYSWMQQVTSTGAYLCK